MLSYEKFVEIAKEVAADDYSLSEYADKIDKVDINESTPYYYEFVSHIMRKIDDEIPEDEGLNGIWFDYEDHFSSGSIIALKNSWNVILEFQDEVDFGSRLEDIYDALCYYVKLSNSFTITEHDTN